ncbi:MAG: Fe-S cluster assembly protein SufD [Bdellovibrionota bacterium]
MASLSAAMNSIASIRAESEDELMRLSLPTRKDEDYRYLPLKGFDVHRKTLVAQGEPKPIPAEYSFLGKEEIGVLAYRSSSDLIDRRLASNSALEGVVFEDLKTAAESHGQLVKAHLGNPAIFSNDLFARLATARWQNGIVLYVPKGVRLELPVRGLHWFDAESQAFYHRTLVIASEGSEVTYVDEFTGSAFAEGQSSGLAVGLVEIVAEANSRVTYVQAQNWDESVEHFCRVAFHIHSQAELKHVMISVGGSKGQVRCESSCLGRGAQARFIAATRASSDQNFNFWVVDRHLAAETTSMLDYWTVAEDQAQVTFNGNVIIPKEAVQTDAYQKNRNLVLSAGAVVNTLPKLEIATDQVKCSHGAVVSSVSQDQLYYLQSRGLSREQAQAMIVDGFTQPVLQELPTEELRVKFGALLARGGESL